MTTALTTECNPKFMRSIAKQYIKIHSAKTFAGAQLWLRETILEGGDENEFLNKLKPYIIEEGQK